MDFESESEAFDGFGGDDFDSDIELDFEQGFSSDSESDSDGLSDYENGHIDMWSGNCHNVDVLSFNEYVGPVHNLEEDSNALDFLNLLIEPDFYKLAAQQTNLYAIQRGVRDTDWSETNETEIKSFVAINILMGIHQLPNLEHYWSNDDRLQVAGIKKIMSRNRFKKINQYFHISDNSQMPPPNSRDFDPFYKLAPLLNMTSRTFHLRYRPHRELSIDEAIVGYKGRHTLKMYNPNKPQKWGFKVWQLADAHNWYVLSQTLYRGKPREPLPYGQGYEVVTDLTAQYQWLRHHLYMDNLFTSVHLANTLLQRDTYMCGTIRANSIGLPDAVKNPERGMALAPA